VTFGAYMLGISETYFMLIAWILAVLACYGNFAYLVAYFYVRLACRRLCGRGREHGDEFEEGEGQDGSDLTRPLLTATSADNDGIRSRTATAVGGDDPHSPLASDSENGERRVRRARLPSYHQRARAPSRASRRSTSTPTTWAWWRFFLARNCGCLCCLRSGVNKKKKKKKRSKKQMAAQHGSSGTGGGVPMVMSPNSSRREEWLRTHGGAIIVSKPTAGGEEGAEQDTS